MSKEVVKQNVLRPAQAKQLLSYLIRGNETILLTGKPGVGKSDILRQAAADAGVELIIMHPAISDPTDFKGLPFPGPNGTAEFRIFGDLKRICASTRPVLVVLEDFGQAPTAVQAAAMQVLHSATGERRIGDHVIPEHVTFALTSNRRADRAGVQGILETVKSRCATIIEVEPTLEDWKGWAIEHDVAPEVIGFLNFRKEHFHRFEPSADLSNFPCPRTWAAVSRLVKLDLPKTLRLQAYSGAVGDGAAAEFIAFLDVYEEAPDIEEIIRNPKTAPIPDASKASILYAVSAGLAYSANQKTMGAICTYAQRMYKAKLSEFATLTIVDSIRRDRKLAKHEGYIEYCLSDAGKHIIEARELG